MRRTKSPARRLAAAPPNRLTKLTARDGSDSVERFHVVVNGTELLSFIGPKVKTPSTPAPQRCVMWALNGTEWNDCFAEAAQRPDFRTSSFSYAYSSARREIIVAVARDSLSQTVELTSNMVHNGYWQRNYTADYFLLSTHLYFISVDTPNTIRTHVVTGRRVEDIAFSDDGKGLVMRAVTYNRLELHTPEEDYVSQTANCRSRFARPTRNGGTYSLTYYVDSPILNGVINYNPDATFAP